jgi:hypothetical protein
MENALSRAETLEEWHCGRILILKKKKKEVWSR